MTPSRDTSAENGALFISGELPDDVHTKDSAAPKENTCKPDHKVIEFVEGANPDDVRRERVTEDVQRTGEVVGQNVKKLLGGGDKAVMLEVPDGKANILVVSGNGGPVKVAVTSRADDNNFPQTKLSQIALTFCAQLSAVFVGNALNKSSSSCSCAASPSPSPSPSPSHSDFSEWITVTVTVTNLIGFVSTLIAVSLENQKSAPTKKRTVSSVAAKFGLAAVASAIIVSMGVALPLGINGNLAFTAVGSLPSVIAVAIA